MWLAEAEIQPGQSIPSAINRGLQTSRFVGLIMTPAYFNSESGWTDAEWHAALHADPDNRQGRILPLLFKDCPDIPPLLKHFKWIDLRGDQYSRGLRQLLRVLKGEHAHPGWRLYDQLATPNQATDQTLSAFSRAPVPAQPDLVREHLWCNLLPVKKLPDHVYVAPLAANLLGASKRRIKEEIDHRERAAGTTRFVPAFRLHRQKVITFHNLDSPHEPLTTVIDPRGIEIVPTLKLTQHEVERTLLTSLLNMAVARHAIKTGLVPDEDRRGRFYFPSRNGEPNIITWVPRHRTVRRTVAKPRTIKGNTAFWTHQAAYLRMLFLAGRFFLQIEPTWVITRDGIHLIRGPRVGPMVAGWTGRERNRNILYHLRFWSFVLAESGPDISIKAGGQRIFIAARPARVELPFGIADDQVDLTALLDEEAERLSTTDDLPPDNGLLYERENHEDYWQANGSSR